MSKRMFYRLLVTGVLLGSTWVLYSLRQGEAVVSPYHSLELGVSLNEAERTLGAPRDHVFKAYDEYEDIHLAEDDAPRNASDFVIYRRGRYLVILNYDPTTDDRRIHRKELVRVRHDWMRRWKDSIPW